MYSFNQLIKFGTDGTTCRVDKDDLCNNKCRTKGVFESFVNTTILGANDNLDNTTVVGKMKIKEI